MSVMTNDLYINNGPLLARPGEFYSSGAVLIERGVVAYAGDAAAAPPVPEGCPVLDAEGGLIMPGLVNGHCHAAMTLFRGLADDLALEEWLTGHIFPAEARWVDQAMVEDCSLLAAAEMLLAGVTTVCDSYFCVDGAMRAFEAAGLRAVAAHGIIDFPAPGAPDPTQNLAVAGEFVKRWSGRSPLLTPGLFVHSTDTCSAETITGAAALADELACPLFAHLSETRATAEQCRAEHGLAPAAWLEELGVLAAFTAGVHGVWLEPAEMELLAARGVGLILCPESNLKLASGVADHRALIAAGVALGLGTDGAASNNNLDLLGEAATLARLAKVKTMDPAAMPAPLALDLATEQGARAMGMGGRVGALAPGLAGDAVVMNLAAPHLTPLFDVTSHLIYAARAADVRHVAVAGRLVVRDRGVLTFDAAEAMGRVAARAREVGA